MKEKKEAPEKKFRTRGENGGRRPKARYLLIALLIVAALGAAAFLRFGGGAVRAERITAAKQPLQDWYTESASLHLGSDVTRISEVSGSVLEICVKEGDSVAAGDLIVRIDPQNYHYELAMAEAARSGYQAQLNAQKAGQVMSASPQEYVNSLSRQLSGAEAAYQAAKTLYDADQALYEAGSISRAQFEKDSADYQAAKAAYEQAQQLYQDSAARLGSLGGGANANSLFFEGETSQIRSLISAQDSLISQLRDQIGKCEVRAEQDGIIKNIEIENVSTVSAGTPLFTLSRRSESGITAEADLLTSVSPYVSVGSPVRARIKTRGDDIVLSGHVTEIYDYAEQGTSALGLEEYRVHVKALLEADEGTDPERFDGYGADLEVLLFDRDDCIVIPSSAAYKENGSYHVLKVVDGRAQSAPISVLYSSGSEIAVSAGLEEGEEILNNIDQEGIKDGVRIR